MMSSFSAAAPSSGVQPKASITTNLAVDGLRSIAINVLGAAGYGQPRNFGEVETAAPGMHFTFMEALFLIINNLITSSLVPPVLLNLPVMPKSVREIGKAITEFPTHQQRIIDTERAARSDVPKSNLLCTLVRLSDEERHSSSTKGVHGAGSYLTEEELRGNLYLITVAGFDTSSNTLAYALLNITVYPELQSWLYEEISQVQSDMSYAETFPKLRRCLALMVSICISIKRSSTDVSILSTKLSVSTLPSCIPHGRQPLL